MAKKLKYLGGGFLPGVPATDHKCSDEEVEERIRSGLYKVVEEEKKPDK